MTDSSVLDFIPQNSPLRTLNSPKSAFGSQLIRVVHPVMIFMDMNSKFYKGEKVYDAESTTREYIPNVHGKIEAVTIVNPKNTQRVNVQGSCLNEETNEKERWVLSLTANGQETYRSLLPKLKVVNLPEQSLTIQPKKGTKGKKATFMEVFINGDPRQSVYGKSIDCSDTALNETVNAIREQLGLQPEYPEWMNLRTDLSQTQSVPTNCETYSEEPESSSQSQI